LHPFSLTTQLGLYSLAGVTSLWLLDMHLFPPRYIHLIQELARQAAIAGACVIMTPEMNITVQSLMATGHNLVRTEHPESLKHRCRCRKRKQKLLRQVQRRNERHMSRMCDQPVGPRIRTCQCPNCQLKRLTHTIIRLRFVRTRICDDSGPRLSSCSQYFVHRPALPLFSR
jgi:excinuclease UvrABC ATPase subunit